MTGPRVLITYHSDNGQTARIADHIAKRLREVLATVSVETLEDNPDPEGFDGVIVGDPIHVGHHSKALRRWLGQHVDSVEQRPNAFFQVSLSSATADEVHTTDARRMVDELLGETDFDPDLVGLFAGALTYRRYGWLKRTAMKRIAARATGDVDTSHDYEYTDWDAVDAFADDFLAHLTAVD
jgi:menaquinone-dependent protoporphyrinogen oxidase